ncbi:MAG: hypothetical protein Q9227_000451 [Pyrenula ochraceoflavens]
MSSTDYTYDEQGQFFPFFILTLTGLVTAPLAYSLLKSNKEIENTAPRIKSDFKPEDDDLIQGRKRRQKRRERKPKRGIAVTVGVAVMAYMIYLIMVTQRTTLKLYDPYQILGLSTSADEKAIQRHYKRLSLKFHPDKVKPDPEKNETMETINEQFVELTKAYKALTDEEVRQNYIQYGHPDGKQSFSIGIALPKLLVTEGNGKYVLMFYGLLLGGLLPYLAGKWWYGTQAVTKEKVLINSAANMFQEYKEDLSDGGVLSVLSTGEEFAPVLKGTEDDSGLSKIEKAVLERAQDGTLLSEDDRVSLKEISDASRRKVLALLWAYLGRIPLHQQALDQERYEVAPIALNLIYSYTPITLAFGVMGPLLGSYHAAQHLIQAIPPEGSALLQLPYFTSRLAQDIKAATRKSSLTVQDFMSFPESTRRTLCTGPDRLTESQYATAMSVARQLPYLKIDKAFFKVVGERVITPSSLVQFVIKARFIPPGSQNIPEINELDLEDVDPDEGDLDAILGRKSKKKRKTADGEEVQSEDDDNIQPPLAHAPYFARDHSPRWHIFLAQTKENRIAVPPSTITSFNKPIFDKNGNPSFNMQTLKMQFQAPPQTGRYVFTMFLICDSYIGFDSSQEVVLEVEDASKLAPGIVEEVEEDEISEPDEDTIAGQMQALKTGSAPKRKAKKPVQEESSDDESDTEGEVEDTSDTDTETDEE